MKLGISALRSGLLALVFAAPFAAMSQNIYLAWPGVPGTATVTGLVYMPSGPSNLVGVIPLKTYSQAFTNDNLTLAKVTKASCGNIRITKSTDNSSTNFLLNAVKNSVIPKLTVAYTSPGVAAGTVYVPVVIVLLNAYVKEVGQVEDTSSANSGKLSDSVALSATTFEVTYYGPQLASGAAGTATKFGWNCQTNSPVTF
jgi:type VI protein secretion system component Hcp